MAMKKNTGEDDSYSRFSIVAMNCYGVVAIVCSWSLTAVTFLFGVVVSLCSPVSVMLRTALRIKVLNSIVRRWSFVVARRGAVKLEEEVSASLPRLRHVAGEVILSRCATGQTGSRLRQVADEVIFRGVRRVSLVSLVGYAGARRVRQRKRRKSSMNL